jgi:hypothetical protein
VKRIFGTTELPILPIHDLRTASSLVRWNTSRRCCSLSHCRSSLCRRRAR